MKTRAQLMAEYAKKTNINTGMRNRKGRVIYRGPLGGRFVRSKSGAKIYSVRMTSPRNDKGRIIYEGKRGGRFVRTATGKKIYI